MSGTLPAHEPECLNTESESVELVVDARPRDLGGFAVRRLLPSPKRRRVGPFTFFDHMGPATLAPGSGMDVRPHPHIALATVTYLFEGEIDHRDSVGSFQTIRPGDVNWMIAGRGIAHSERTGPEARKRGSSVHGIQSWVALPTDKEEVEPSFAHHPKASLPRIVREGVSFDVIAGTAFGEKSPVNVLSPTLYAHALLDSEASFVLDTEHQERAIYGRAFGPGTLVVLRAGKDVTVRARTATRAMILGGAHLPGERYMWWNFVSSSKERLERAKDDWKNGRFAKVAGDESEFIPLPDAGPREH
jgi:redox-sensitive bicupin YhaK (pirin superfamily)